MSFMLSINQKVAENILQTALELFIDTDFPTLGCIGICSLDKGYIKIISFGGTAPEELLETDNYLRAFDMKRNDDSRPFLIAGTPHYIAGVEFEEFVVAGRLPTDEETSHAIVSLYGLYHQFWSKHKIMDDETLDMLLFVVDEWDKKYFANQKLLYLAQRVFKPEFFCQTNPSNNKVGSFEEEDFPGLYRF
jgi:hypothetical protein